MRIKAIVVSQIGANCYVVAQDADKGNDAVIIDPGDIVLDPVFAYIEEEGLNVVAIWNTHAHFDHVMGVDVARARYRVPAYVHEADMPIWNQVADATLQMFGRTVPPLAPPDGYFTEGQVLSLGDETFTIWHTPGHSPGSVCLVGGDVAFTGDTLFAGTIGATHFFLGDPKAMEQSLKRLMKLPDDMVLYPGHGHRTTMNRERMSNPYLPVDVD
ncbi:MBL fold metallo-hydrolase [Alicyclobacillus cycloheptanicus]|jgi:glyoxylase-like metal-dependent hydrolase (beta-lactamase superfamily II)|uniref:Glyoxylase-like metal-dependent hydrolase (Beta-lactamase superfamily II) n=1 Tax=Alicyclobacillus cycloheptanicus TaxID=1457 RepID=A0ABT9XEL1_9BACL|nr:MBL fold metallo-hydrolase [Alicyclobacillus cycloheptanicus]MDQ0188722.1 glyoxylase-like metal-dependent hydrolase (beta-lactamase superfamily II) [Alicyclobacillus cycloheptanicus]WDM00612.1 MBL fold metallo-hydrolase [Alicyclobacillus cycloheptanicus]